MIIDKHVISGKCRELDPRDIRTSKSKKMLASSVVLPSQYHAYSICVEFIKNWFLDKFSENYFNSVYVDGKHSFDEFINFSDIDQQLKKINPLLMITPVINMEHNRQWVDSSPEFPLLLQRTRLEGSFFNDINDTNSTHLQIIFKTILMNFTFRMRVNTRAEELDLCEYIKLKHRAGWSETQHLSLDIHIPKHIITQIAYDKGFELDENLNVKKPHELIKYLNSKSLIPFIYKYRCSTGNNEFFIKVPNCTTHIKSELPSIDDGERQGMNSTNYTVEFQLEAEMTAPYAFTYYSQNEQKYIKTTDVIEDKLCILKSSFIATDIPKQDEHKWDLYSTTEYLIEKEDLGTEIEIDFKEYFKYSDLNALMEYTRDIGINPVTFVNFKFFNNGIERDYEINWNDLTCKIIGPAENITTVIAVYCDMSYINDTNNYLHDLEKSRIE